MRYRIVESRHGHEPHHQDDFEMASDTEAVADLRRYVRELPEPLGVTFTLMRVDGDGADERLTPVKRIKPRKQVTGLIPNPSGWPLVASEKMTYPED